jgi:hypothetical protein
MKPVVMRPGPGWRGARHRPAKAWRGQGGIADTPEASPVHGGLKHAFQTLACAPRRSPMERMTYLL